MFLRLFAAGFQLPRLSEGSMCGVLFPSSHDYIYYKSCGKSCQVPFSVGRIYQCIRVKHRLHKAQRAQSRERWRFAKQIRPDLDCGKKAIQWEGAVRQALPNSLGYFVLLRACARRLYHITPAYFASTWLGDCIPRHVMMWSLDCRWYTASCFLPSSRLYIRMCR